MNNNRLCPVCDFNKVKEIRKFNFTLFDKHPMHKGYLVVQCDKCGFIYGDTDLTQSMLEDYYENLSNSMITEIHNSVKPDLLNTLYYLIKGYFLSIFGINSCKFSLYNSVFVVML
jgi:hypothetical protein